MNASSAFVRCREFIKYTLASSLSLLVDYVTYILILHYSETALPTAAAAGYSTGIISSYFLISRKVFKNGWLKERRNTEFALFLVSVALGIGLTYTASAIVVMLLGNMINVAKLTAVVVSFIGVYMFRKHVVFQEKRNMITL
jgi:putative flippase GtrA